MIVPINMAVDSHLVNKIIHAFVSKLEIMLSVEYKFRPIAFNVTGIAMLVGAGFFGYMLALLQRRLGTIVASQDVSAFSCLLPSDALYKKRLI